MFGGAKIRKTIGRAFTHNRFMFGNIAYIYMARPFLTIKNSDMKEIIKDFMDENFTKREVLLYGVGYPLLLLAICVAAEWINSL